MLQGDVTIYPDSQSAIHLSKNPIYHDRTKHVDVKYHFVREQISSGIIKVMKIPSEDNPADMGTMIVTTTKFNHCMNLLHVEVGK